jgi:hypothetical protein
MVEQRAFLPAAQNGAAVTINVIGSERMLPEKTVSKITNHPLFGCELDEMGSQACLKFLSTSITIAG